VEGRKCLAKMARKTDTELSSEYLDVFDDNMVKNAETATKNEGKTYFTILDLFKYRQMGLVAVNLALAFLERIYC
jgi:hypothetical protein